MRHVDEPPRPHRRSLLAVGVLAALAEREASGVGRHLELAQTEAAAYLIGENYLEAARAGVDPAPLGNAHPTASPHGVYPSAGDLTSG